MNNKDEYNRCLIPVLQVHNPERKVVIREERSEIDIEKIFKERPEIKRELREQVKLERKRERKKLTLKGMLRSGPIY